MNMRHEERPNLMTYLEVRCAESGHVVGRIVDLTTSGMRLITEEDPRLDADYHLVVPIEDGPGGQQELYIDARCVWVGRDINPELGCAGFEFEEIRPRQEALLAQIIRRQRFERQHS